MATLTLNKGFWRHSNKTLHTIVCKRDDSGWTPCRGGIDASYEGTGYCQEGYTGPHCEVCVGPEFSKYFDKLDAKCHECGDVAAKTSAYIAGIVAILLATVASGVVVRRLLQRESESNSEDEQVDGTLRCIQTARAVWEKTGMRYKFKALVGFYQCISAAPSVFDVTPPLGLEEYAKLLQLLELPTDLENLFLRSDCFGNYGARLRIGSLWPIVFLFCFAVGFIGWEAFQQALHRKSDTAVGAEKISVRAVVAGGLRRTLPLTLLMTFLVVPSTSTRIFRTFLCEPIEFGNGKVRRYLYADLRLSCDSAEYTETNTAAVLFLIIWPVGCPVLYALLLWSARDALRAGVHTPLSEAIGFMVDDYTVDAYWWEPLEMSRKLVLTGWVLLITESSEQGRVLVGLLVSIAFLVLRLSFRPTKRRDDSSLMTLTELALVLVYVTVLVIKTCDQSALLFSTELQGQDNGLLTKAICSTYGFGEDAAGVFLFFIFFGLSMIVVQVAFDTLALLDTYRQQKQLRRLRYVKGDAFVEIRPINEGEFLHLPGLEPSKCFHLFLSHAWPIGQDVCKLVKQRCREICPSLKVFLDVEDLASGSGTKEVDHSRCILVFAMPVYFEKFNCVKEMTRAIVRDKSITVLLPDSEVHGVFTADSIRSIVTDEWVAKWKLQKRLADWATEWGVGEIPVPTAETVCHTLLRDKPLEWSRLTPFQDHTMVLMCQRVLHNSSKRIYLQGEQRFSLPKGHTPIKLYCSPHNPGAAELADELNQMVLADAPRTKRGSRNVSRCSSDDQLRRRSDDLSDLELSGLKSSSVSEHVSVAVRASSVAVGREAFLLKTVDDVSEADHMLLYLNGSTWTHEPQKLAVDIRLAQQAGVHLQPCHEFPSVLDIGSQRKAREFKDIMDSTPSQLKKGDGNIYKQIAIPLKGANLRHVGLHTLAAALATCVLRAPIESSFSFKSSKRHVLLQISKSMSFNKSGRSSKSVSEAHEPPESVLQVSATSEVATLEGAHEAQCSKSMSFNKSGKSSKSVSEAHEPPESVLQVSATSVAATLEAAGRV